ncbi:hypothetical protein LINGRAHAP2_LOCUS21371 [Linum grandiflorum]
MVTSADPHPSAASIAALVHRRKRIWRLSMIFNFAIGAYIFSVASKRNGGSEVQKPARRSAEHGRSKVESLPEENLDDDSVMNNRPPSLPLTESISEEEQQRMFKWMLEEKQKFEPGNSQEMKRVGEDKAILQLFMGSSSKLNP